MLCRAKMPLPIYHYPHLIDYTMPIPPSVLYEESKLGQPDCSPSTSLVSSSSSSSATTTTSTTTSNRTNHLITLTQLCNNYCREFNLILSNNGLRSNSTLLNDDYEKNSEPSSRTKKKLKLLKNKKKKKKKKLDSNGNQRKPNSSQRDNELSNQEESAASLILNNKLNDNYYANGHHLHNYLSAPHETVNFNYSPQNFHSSFKASNGELSGNMKTSNLKKNRSKPYNVNTKSTHLNGTDSLTTSSSSSFLPLINQKSNTAIFPSLSSSSSSNENSFQNYPASNISPRHTSSDKNEASKSIFVCNWLLNNNSKTKCNSSFKTNEEYNDHIKYHTTNELVSGLNLYYQAKYFLNQPNGSQSKSLPASQGNVNSNNTNPSAYFLPKIF